MPHFKLKINLILSFIFINFFHFTTFGATQQDLIDQVQPHTLVGNALTYADQLRAATCNDMDALLNLARTSAKPIDHFSFLEKWAHKVHTWTLQLNDMGKILQPLAAGTEAAWDLKTQKMIFAIDGALKILSDDKEFELIRSGHPSPNYNFWEIKNAPTLGEGFYGSYKGVNYKTALLFMLMELTYSSRFYDIPLPGGFQSFLKRSPVVHFAPLPEKNKNKEDIDWSFLESSPFYAEILTDKGIQKSFIYTTNGYAFGGDIPQDKSMAPTDCSGGLSFLMGTPRLSTKDLWWYYGAERGLFSEESLDKKRQIDQWKENPIFTALKNCLECIEDGEQKPGDIYAHRTFGPNDSFHGNGGHTAVYLGTLDGQFSTIRWNRGLPSTLSELDLEKNPLHRIDGVGLQLFPNAPNSVKKIFFLRLLSAAKLAEDE